MYKHFDLQAFTFSDFSVSDCDHIVVKYANMREKRKKNMMKNVHMHFSQGHR